MYCTANDLMLRLDSATLVSLADDNADGVADVGVIEAAIADASGEVDALLGGRHGTLAGPVPSVLRGACTALAIGRLFARRGEAAHGAQRDAEKGARELLRAIGEGRMRLAGARTSGGPESSRAAGERVTRGDALKGL